MNLFIDIFAITKNRGKTTEIVPQSSVGVGDISNIYNMGLPIDWIHRGD